MDNERQVAVDLFNGTWALLRREDRGPEDDAAMIHSVHASVHHWSKVGTGVNLARGEWQVARVYSVLGRGEPAMWHAQRCLALCAREELDDWDLAYAHEAVARAAVASRDLELARKHLTAARAVPIAEDDDRELVQTDLAEVEASLAA